MAEEQRRSELLSGHAFWRHDLQRW
jgi:hypothetical protein